MSSHYRIGLRPSGNGPTAIAAGKVVVAIGSLTSHRASDSNPHSPINDFYSPAGNGIARLRIQLDRVESAGFVLVVSSSAISLGALPNASRRAHPRTRPVHHRHLALRRTFMICNRPPEFDFPRLRHAALASDRAADLCPRSATISRRPKNALNLADLYDALPVWAGAAQMDLVQQEGSSACTA